MKLMFASDIHGSALYAEKLLARLKDEAPQRLVLLGDILYHGPRNELPDGYAPKEVAAMLNALRPRPLCVRGNCEAEVDQMMLEFPVMAEYFPLLLDGAWRSSRMATFGTKRIFRRWRRVTFSSMGIPMCARRRTKGPIIFLNPGSVSIPKGDGVRGYMVYEEPRVHPERPGRRCAGHTGAA